MFPQPLQDRPIGFLQTFRFDTFIRQVRRPRQTTAAAAEQDAGDPTVEEAFPDLRARLIRNPGPNPKLTYLEDLKLIGALYQLSET